MELIIPNVKGVPYDPQKAVRIVDPNQWTYYLFEGLKPYDIYPSRGIIVMVFDRKESYPYYKKYMDRKESESNEKL